LSQAEFERDPGKAAEERAASADGCWPKLPPYSPEWEQFCADGRCDPRNETEAKWAALEPWTRPGKEERPKLAILMLLRTGLSKPELWSRWLEEADKAGLSSRLIIHKRDARVPLLGGSKDFQRFVLSEPVNTSWCHCGDAVWYMMEQALLDHDVTHLATVSGDSIPVKPMKFIYDTLSKAPTTRLCMDFNAGMRAETWWIMSRPDANFLVAHREEVEKMFKLACEEERQFMLPLVQRSYHHGRRALPLVNECVMFTDWTGQCRDWANHNDLGNFTHLRTKERYRNSKEAHPRMYLTLSKASLAELEASPFWFARKFL